MLLPIVSMQKAAIIFLALFLFLFISPQKSSADYTLPYPGLLPDSKIYFLKIVRDRIVAILTSDPLKKAEFNLLTSDKRLAAGIALFEKKKYDLSESTLSKGENYFEDTISQLKEAAGQGMHTKDMWLNLSQSTQKHNLVIANLEKRSPKETKSKFTNLVKRAKHNKEMVDSIKPQ